MHKDCLSEKSIEKLSSDQSFMVSIVISNYNGEKHLLECLSSLMQLDYPLYEVIVIDAGSTDNSVAIIKHDFPKVRVVEKGKIGIGEAINCGIALAQGEFIVFDLNNDDIVDKKWLSNLIQVIANSPDVGVVCGKRFQYGSNKILDSVGGNISFFTGNTLPIGHNKYSIMYNVQMEIDYAPVIATRREILEKVGLCDPVYYIYHEDSDFCLRVKRFGYKIVFVPSAAYWHKGSSTIEQQYSRKSYYYSSRNQIRFVLKNFPLSFMFIALFYSVVLKTIHDFPVLVPPIGKTVTRFSPFFREYTWVKNDSTLIRVRVAAILWNVKNLKNTIMARYQNLR